MTPRRVVAALALSTALSSCDASTAVPEEVARLSIAASDTVINPGLTLQLTAAAWSRSGAAMADPDVAWLSRNARVLTVSASGLVTAVASGAATVVAASGAIADSVRLVVRRAGCESPTGVPLALGETHTVRITRLTCVLFNTVPANGHALPTASLGDHVLVSVRSSSFTPNLHVYGVLGPYWSLFSGANGYVEARLRVTTFTDAVWVAGIGEVPAADGVADAEYTIAIDRAAQNCTAADASESLAFGVPTADSLTARSCLLFGSLTSVGRRFVVDRMRRVQLRGSAASQAPQVIVTDTNAGTPRAFHRDTSLGTTIVEATLRAGRYAVWVSGFGGAVGAVSLQMDSLPPCPPTGDLNVGVIATGELTASDCQLMIPIASRGDRWTFALTEDSDLELELTSDSIEPYLTLVDSTGSVVSERSSVGAAAARLQLSLSRGLYDVWAGGQRLGAYTLRVRRTGSALRAGRPGAP